MRISSLLISYLVTRRTTSLLKNQLESVSLESMCIKSKDLHATLNILRIVLVMLTMVEVSLTIIPTGTGQF
jgi:hypothetical protein